NRPHPAIQARNYDSASHVFEEVISRNGSHLTRGQLGIEHLAGTLGSAHRQASGIEQSNLYQHARLIPVDMLMRDLSILHPGNDDDGHLYALPRGRDARQHPVNRRAVREADHKFVYYLIASNGT